jgi:hypothetical protein
MSILLNKKYTKKEVLRAADGGVWRPVAKLSVAA